MSLKSRRVRKGADAEVMMDINTTPLIDVMLVLLVMLIITIPIQLHAVNLEMPVGTPPISDTKPQKIQVDIDGKNFVYWQGIVISTEEFEKQVARIAVMNPQPEVHIRPDKESAYAVFANVLSTFKRQGLSRMAVIGHEQFTR